MLMVRDFRRKSLSKRCLVPVFDSPGVPSSPLESSAVVETLWRRLAPDCDELKRLCLPSKADPPRLDDDQVSSDFLVAQGAERLQDLVVHPLNWKFVRKADHDDPWMSSERKMKNVAEPDISREQGETAPLGSIEHL